MRRQGRLSWRTDSAGRVLERLAGLEKVIPPDTVRQALHATQRRNDRACPLSHEVMLWVVLGMGIFTDLPLRGDKTEGTKGRATQAIFSDKVMEERSVGEPTATQATP